MPTDPTAHLVVVRADVNAGAEVDTLRMSLERYPVWAGEYVEVPGAHLAVRLREPDVGLRQSASVVIDSLLQGIGIGDAVRTMCLNLEKYPGAFLVAVQAAQHQVVALASDDSLLVVDSLDEEPLPCDLAASALREWKLTGSTARTLVVTAGSKEWRASVTVLR
jgi:hypothetical protein